MTRPDKMTPEEWDRYLRWRSVHRDAPEMTDVEDELIREEVERVPAPAGGEVHQGVVMMVDTKQEETKAVPVIEEMIRASDVVLADGTMLSVRPVIRGVRRVIGKKTEDGFPLYTVLLGAICTTVTAKKRVGNDSA